MADVVGQRRTDNIASSQRAIDLSKEILLLEPDAAPITVVLKSIYNGGRSRPTTDVKFSWHNDELEGRFDAINNGGGYNNAATTLAVDNADLFAEEDLVYVPRTGEMLLVTSVDEGADTIDVVRGVGATSAAALNDDEELYIVGTADNEGDTSVPARANNPTKVDNYTQIFKHSVEMSGSQLSASNMSSPHDWNHQRRKQGIEHLKDIELAFILGTPAENQSPGSGKGPRRTTGGLLHFCTENAQSSVGELTEVEFEEFLRRVFRYGSQSRTLFASALLVSALNQFAQHRLETVVGTETYGVKVMNWISPHGEVKIVKHNLLEGATLGGLGIAVDFARSEIAYRYLKGDAPGESRDTRLIPNVQPPDLDGRKDQWITECGLQVGLPKCHGVISGVTGADPFPFAVVNNTVNVETEA